MLLSAQASRLNRGSVLERLGRPISPAQGALCIRAERGGVERALVDGDAGRGEYDIGIEEKVSEKRPRHALA